MRVLATCLCSGACRRGHLPEPTLHKPYAGSSHKESAKTVQGQRKHPRGEQTCRQPLSQNSRMSQATLSLEAALPLRPELVLGFEDACTDCPDGPAECTLSWTILLARIESDLVLSTCSMRLWAHRMDRG